MESWITPEAGLLGLFISGFLAATLFPGASEAVLFALVKLHPEQATEALLPATLGNTLGGMTTYRLARLLPQRFVDRLSPARLVQMRRWGPVSLLFVWMPVIGDALCAAAGALACLPCPARCGWRWARGCVICSWPWGLRSSERVAGSADAASYFPLTSYRWALSARFW
ncbi:MAG: DedA family protein [Accumulibacter sp.]|jgi:membrane protein YqaA with SNARE-associated domain